MFGELLEPGDGGCYLRVQVQPRASRPGIVDVKDGAVRVRVMAPALEGEANRALRRVLADELGIRASAVEIVAGLRSRRKRVFLQGVFPEVLKTRLSQIPGWVDPDPPGTS